MDFGRALATCLGQVGRGRVTTCGAIARALGDVRAARAVATWLVDHPETPGGHRVVRADGRPLLPKATYRLGREGIDAAHGRVPAKRMVGALKPVDILTRLREEQRDLGDQVVERYVSGDVNRIAGVDAAYDGDSMFVAAVCLDAEELTPSEIVTVRREASFPYIPTYLAYRESPGIEAAVRRLTHPPDVLLVDGHGRLHPALFGVACYVGVRLGLPTIGVAKHPLVGRMKPSRREPRAESPVEFRGRVQGYAWTPPGRARPIFVSVGNRISLDRSLEIVRGSTRHGYPEPLKVADRVCREMKGNEKREKGATG
jgi:deoxyribonuclease V